jgi:DNA polymerase III epsilon subunit-like protein
MKVLIFDVETTGLLTEKNASITDVDKWPYIVQLSYLVYHVEAKYISLLVDEIIKLPEHINISDECVSIHGITNEKSSSSGINIKDSLIKFNEYLKTCYCIIGHNLSFDKRLIMVECIRNNVYHNFTVNNIKKPEYCTMKNGVNICKIERFNLAGHKYFKFPTLSELYYHYFKKVPDGLHNSKNDILVTLRCYCAMALGYDVSKYINIPLFNEETDDFNVSEINTSYAIGNIVTDNIIGNHSTNLMSIDTQTLSTTNTIELDYYTNDFVNELQPSNKKQRR